MASYYTLGASLPDLNPDDSKTEYSTQDFVTELKTEASKSDKALIDLILLPGDNRLLISIITQKEAPINHMPLALGEEKLQELLAWQKEPEEYPRPQAIPAYLFDFLKEYDNRAFEEDQHFLIDRLSELYYKYATKKGDRFLKSWFQLTHSINAVLTAIIAKKFDLDRKKYLVGDDELIKILREGSWNELSTMDDAEIISEIMKIGEESNLAQKERRIDAFKWKILDEMTFADPFSIDAMIAYLLKLQILERWITLDRETGLQRFREMITSLKKEGKEELASFVEKTKK